MAAIVEPDIFRYTLRSFELLWKAILTFDSHLENELPLNSKQYRRACGYLRDGQGFYEASLKQARKLLGTGPHRSALDVEMQRIQFLADNKIIVRGRSLYELREELLRDEFLKTMISPGEILIYLNDHFISQSSGKRRLANMKMRLILDKLRALLVKAQELQIHAQRYYYPD